MALFSWSEDFSVKVKEIDEQHKKLISIINEAYEIFYAEIPSMNFEDTLKKLLKFSKEHFSTEEKYFEKFNYEKKEEHLKKHSELIDRLNKIKKTFNRKDKDAPLKIIKLLSDWLHDHLIKEDQKYVKCFKSNGLK